jgi:hypothetical protein
MENGFWPPNSWSFARPLVSLLMYSSYPILVFRCLGLGILRSNLHLSDHQHVRPPVSSPVSFIGLIQYEAPKIAKLVYNSNVTMVYGIYNELVTGANPKQVISWGPHIVSMNHIPFCWRNLQPNPIDYFTSYDHWSQHFTSNII